MGEPVSESAHYLTGFGGDENQVVLVEGGRCGEVDQVQVLWHRQGYLAPGQGSSRGGGRLTRLVARVAGLIGIVGVVAGLGGRPVVIPASAEPGASRCSLAWPEITRNFGPGSGWELAAPPIPFAIGDEGTPQYQAHVFESSQESRMALIVAEWGEPDSPRLGPVVYCTVHGAEGTILEELGHNPLTLTTVPTACRQCV